MGRDAAEHPEERARETIDQKLVDAGWEIQDRDEMNVGAGPGVAIREFKTDAGFADYLLYVDKKPVGEVEAKKEGVVLTGIEAETRDYADKVPNSLPVPRALQRSSGASAGAATHAYLHDATACGWCPRRTF